MRTTIQLCFLDRSLLFSCFGRYDMLHALPGILRLARRDARAPAAVLQAAAAQTPPRRSVAGAHLLICFLCNGVEAADPRRRSRQLGVLLLVEDGRHVGQRPAPTSVLEVHFSLHEHAREGAPGPVFSPHACIIKRNLISLVLLFPSALSAQHGSSHTATHKAHRIARTPCPGHRHSGAPMRRALVLRK